MNAVSNVELGRMCLYISVTFLKQQSDILPSCHDWSAEQKWEKEPGFENLSLALIFLCYKIIESPFSL